LVTPRSTPLPLRVIDGASHEVIPEFALELTSDRNVTTMPSTATDEVESPTLTREWLEGGGSLRVAASGYETSSGIDSKALKEGAVELIVPLEKLTPERLGSIRVRGRDESGLDVPHLQLNVRLAGDGNALDRALGREEVDEVRGLAPGSYAVTVTWDDSRALPEELEAKVRPGEVTWVNAVLRRGGRIILEVRNSSGDYVPLDKIQLRDADGRSIEADLGSGKTVTSDGGVMSTWESSSEGQRCTSKALPPGTYTLRLESEGLEPRTESVEIRSAADTLVSVTLQIRH
jgi:hypothetical protein